MIDAIAGVKIKREIVGTSPAISLYFMNCNIKILRCLGSGEMVLHHGC